MRGIVTVVAAAELTAITTLQAVKDELGIADSSQDERLQRMIRGATDKARAELNRVLPRETVSEAFRAGPEYGGDAPPAALSLSRWPVDASADFTVTVDGTELASSDYELDVQSGLLWRLSCGLRCGWRFASAVVAYTGGYAMPGSSIVTLPADIEDGALALIRSRYAAMGRDPSLRRREIPGVISEDFWIENGDSTNALPPEVERYWSPHRVIPV